ncbi:MAG TPA: DUF1292 domain-containing protein [Clostridia bacterium]|nr:DUF1292 domain-containing protein [Clostridia bacterium]
MTEDSRRGETIILKDGEGYDIEHEYLDCIRHGGKEYLVLLPIEQPIDGGNEVEIVQVLNYGLDSEEYKSISSDEFNKILAEYKEKMKNAVDMTNIDLSFIGQDDDE